MKRRLIFAYGSNMHPDRMRARAPGAVSRGRARLAGHRLVLNKHGRDGSAKANLAEDPEGLVWGVVWELPASEVLALDRHEGGYERVVRPAHADDAGPVEVEVYVSSRLTDDPVPHGWYKEHLVGGARAHALPEDYVRWLESLPAREDAEE